MSKMGASCSIEEFWEIVDRVYGAYLDANAGFHTFLNKLDKIQTDYGDALKLPIAELDKRPFFYGEGAPDDPGAIVLHKVTQGQLKHRNRENGENSLFLGAMSLVAIYQYWEDRFRAEIADELSIKRKDLKDDVLGDLRLLRIAIIHQKSIAKEEISRCKCLLWFKSGDPIEINKERMKEIVSRLRATCDKWIAERNKLRGCI